MAKEVLPHDMLKTVCVGGPWDGLNSKVFPDWEGRRVQFPYSEKQAALLTRQPEPDDPLPQTHMAIYQYDDQVSEDGILYCRHEQSYTLEEWHRINEERRAKRDKPDDSSPSQPR